MRGCDFYGSRAKFQARVIVGNQRDFPIRQRQAQHLADFIGIARVGRVDRDCRISQERFRARRRHGYEPGAVTKRVGDVPERAVRVNRFHFNIGNDRLKPNRPVHHPCATVNQTGVKEAHKRFRHGLGIRRVHREALAGPVIPAAEPLELKHNPVAVFFFPGPDPLHELFAA